jgi:hypothetical protein
MLPWLRKLSTALRDSRRSNAAGRGRPRAKLTVEHLENRDVPSTFSSVSGNFNNTPIPANDTVWFDASFKVSNLGQAPSVTIGVTNQTISFTANGTNYKIPVPESTIVISKTNTVANTTYDAGSGSWMTSLPLNFNNGFLAGVAFPVGTTLPGNIQNVTWSGDFSTDVPDVTVTWQWSAAVYTSFGSSYGSLGVTPVDSPSGKAGTPTAYKSDVTAGATGNGGNNYTGNPVANSSLTIQSIGDALVYPFPSSNPRTSIVFNESDVLAHAQLDTTDGFFNVWYSDEHALSLGVSQVTTITASGTQTSNYTVTPMPSNPGVVQNPQVGAPNGVDPSGRPIAPTLYITDITNNPNNLSGDWQYGGTGYSPNAVYGTWKSATETIDYTKSTTSPTITLTPGTDPTKNDWNLGTGSTQPPAGTASQGFGTEIQWNLKTLAQEGILLPGHNYRFYVMVHDGDQNKSGGDVGQAAFNENNPLPPQPGTISGDVGFTSAIKSGPMYMVTVTLLDSNEHIVATTTTDLGGNYTFSNVPAGTYTLVVSIPKNYSADMTSAPGGNGTWFSTSTTEGFTNINLTSGANDPGYNLFFSI